MDGLSSIEEEYARLLADTDDFARGFENEFRDELRCGPGCTQCCQGGFGVFVIEGLRMFQAIIELPRSTRDDLRRNLDSGSGHGDEASCPLLIEGMCSIYAARPIICRTQGLALRFVDQGQVYVDVCPLNFTEELRVEELDPEEMLDLDQLNARLALLAHSAEQTKMAAHDLPSPRVPIVQLLSRALSLAERQARG